jgi:hypothetical protein
MKCIGLSWEDKWGWQVAWMQTIDIIGIQAVLTHLR